MPVLGFGVWQLSPEDCYRSTLAALRALGKKLVFVTNNSTKSRAGYLKKFTGLGLDVRAEEIYSSSYACL